MKRTYPQTFAEIFDEVLRESRLEDSFREQRACFLWPEVVGDGVNRRTIRRTVSGGVMHVWLNSAPLRQELEFMKETIRERINSAVGAPVITSLVFH